MAEEVYATLGQGAARRRPDGEAELAVVNLWIQQVYRRDQRLAAAGLTVPRELDPTLKKALVRCYELQAGLRADSPKLQQVRAVWDTIVGHYKRLEYDDVAEAAIKLKPEKAGRGGRRVRRLPARSVSQEDQARRELARLLKQYGAAEKIALTPALKTVIAAWTKFITDRPTSPLARQAVEQVFGIGRLFEQQRAFDVAAGVYGDFAKFAAGREGAGAVVAGHAEHGRAGGVRRGRGPGQPGPQGAGQGGGRTQAGRSAAGQAERRVRRGHCRLQGVRRGQSREPAGGRRRSAR